MNIPDPIAYAAIISGIGLQTWIVKQIFALKQAVAELSPRHHRMKSRSSVTSLILLLTLPWCVLLLLATGCSTDPGLKIERLFLQPRTNLIEMQATNVEPGIPLPPPTIVTNIDLVIRPELKAVLDTGQAVAGAVPAPFGPAVQLGLAALSGVLALYARHRNAAASSANKQLETIVIGVEHLPDEVAKQAKASIRGQSILDGIAKDLHATVQRYTE